jgi:hypothetical protein
MRAFNVSCLPARPTGRWCRAVLLDWIVSAARRRHCRPMRLHDRWHDALRSFASSPFRRPLLLQAAPGDG